MDELIENEVETQLPSKTKLFGSLLKALESKQTLDESISGFLYWISTTYFPNNLIFFPATQGQIQTELGCKLCVFGEDVVGIAESHPLSKATISIVNADNELDYGLTSELISTDLRKEFSAANITAFNIISLKSGVKPIGFLALLETDATRLWDENDIEELNSFALVFSHKLYGIILEDRLFAKESILQKAIESSNDGYWHIDLVQNKMHFSRQWKRMLGFDENEIEDTFETFENLIHPEDREVVLRVLDPYLKIGVGSYECEYRIKNKLGKYLWVLTRANVNYSENGNPLQFVATNTDVTSRIEYKRQIAQSEAKYEKLISAIDEVIFVVDKNGMITFLNDAWERHLLLKVKKSIGTMAIKYIHPDDRAYGGRAFSAKYSGSDVEHIRSELKFIAANGGSVWMEAHSTIKFDENHELIEVSGTLINIDERKHEETAKKESENKLFRITEHISDIITEFDEQVNVLYISKSIQQLTGVEPKEVVGINVLKDIHPDDRDMVQERVMKPLLDGAKEVVEQFRIHKKDGGYVWVESIIQPLISSSGGRTFIATMRDISARHDAEQEMQRALQKERDLNVLKSRFITMTSHEFRTPLSSIQSSIELLEMYAEDLGERFMKPFEKHFQKVTSQVSRINSLLNNIDTLGKIEGMEMPFNPINQNLVEFVKNLINEKVAEDFPARSVNLKILGEPKVVNVDPSLIDNMLCNILKNAFLYSAKENPDCTIQFNENDFVITVEDKGLGIPEDEMSHLFQSFFRARNIVNLNIPGNGLGLVIAKRIADIHNGTIIVESEENVGTKVTMTLPIKQ